MAGWRRAAGEHIDRHRAAVRRPDLDRDRRRRNTEFLANGWKQQGGCRRHRHSVAGIFRAGQRGSTAAMQLTSNFKSGGTSRGTSTVVEVGNFSKYSPM